MSNFGDSIWEKYVIRKETIQNMGVEEKITQNNDMKMKFIDRLKFYIKKIIKKIARGYKEGHKV